MVLTRKQLPPFGFLKNIKFDVETLIHYCNNNNLLDPELYNDIKVDSNSPEKGLVTVNDYTVNNFFLEDNGKKLNGELYRQLYLTEIFEGVSDQTNFKQTSSSAITRLKRINPNSELYTPEADELNYGKRNDLVKGPLKDLLDFFKSRPTRVRFAYLAPNFSIKPHVDYDPSYITRYHLPLITNTKCTMKVFNWENRSERIYETHFPADGRLYFLNTGKKHCAENNSNQPRIHLIVDVHGQIELTDLISLD